jgi:hypothetical protein
MSATATGRKRKRPSCLERFLPKQRFEGYTTVGGV